jgi:hypothetical protein
VAIGVNTSISSADLTAQTTGTKTVTLPSGTVGTDVVIVAWGLDDNNTSAPTIIAPAGWTAVDTSIRTAVGSKNITLYAFWALGGVANLGFTCTVLTSSIDLGWVCVGFTGVNNTTPIDAVGGTNSSTGATTLTTNAVTVATDQAWHAIAFCDWLGGGTDTFSATGFTAKQNGGAHATAALLYNTTPKSTGSTGTVVVTSSDAAANQIENGMPFALRPAGAATKAPPPYRRPRRWFRTMGGILLPVAGLGV